MCLALKPLRSGKESYLALGLQKLDRDSLPILLEASMPCSWYCSKIFPKMVLHLTSCVSPRWLSLSFTMKSKRQFAMQWLVTPSSKMCMTSYVKVFPLTPGICPTRWVVGVVPLCSFTVALQAAVALKSFRGMSLLLASQLKQHWLWEDPASLNSFWKYSPSPVIAQSTPFLWSGVSGVPAKEALLDSFFQSLPRWSFSGCFPKNMCSKDHLRICHTFSIVSSSKPSPLAMAPLGKARSKSCEQATEALLRRLLQETTLMESALWKAPPSPCNTMGMYL